MTALSNISSIVFIGFMSENILFSDNLERILALNICCTFGFVHKFGYIICIPSLYISYSPSSVISVGFSFSMT